MFERLFLSHPRGSSLCLNFHKFCELISHTFPLIPGGYSWEFLVRVHVPPGSPNPDPISDQKMSFSTPVFRPGARFSKAPIINRPVKLLLFTCKIEVSIVLHLTL